MIELTNEELLSRLANFEDNFVERKKNNQRQQWVNTVVAFANSVPVGYPAVLFIGVKDDGTIQENGNLETLQKTFDKEMKNTYPPIYTLPKALEKDGKRFLAVIVPGSPERPHFAGLSYIREGPETKKASDGQFNRLIAERQSKTYKILESKKKTVTVIHRKMHGNVQTSTTQDEATLEDCNQFWVTILFRGNLMSHPLSRVDLSFDPQQNRLVLEITTT